MTPMERWAIFQITGRRPRRSPRTGRRGPARDYRYRAWIRTLPCASCEADIGIQAAHTGHDGGMALKASDYSCVPLCIRCHMEFDNGKVSGLAFEAAHNIDLAADVRRLNSLWFRHSREVK